MNGPRSTAPEAPRSADQEVPRSPRTVLQALDDVEALLGGANGPTIRIRAYLNGVRGYLEARAAHQEATAPEPLADERDAADIIAGALQTSRAYAWGIMETALKDRERFSAQPLAAAKGLPPLPLGKRMGSRTVNGKYYEIRMHDDAAMQAYARQAVAQALADAPKPGE